MEELDYEREFHFRGSEIYYMPAADESVADDGRLGTTVLPLIGLTEIHTTFCTI